MTSANVGSTDRVRVAVIGCGRHATRSLFPSLRPAGLELVAVCDADEARARDRAEEHGLDRAYTDYRRMCDAERIDAILIAIGPQQHYEIGLEMLQRGYHVFTEKPCSATAAQAEEMANASREAGRVCQTGFNYRFTSGVAQAQAMIASGQFAKPAMIAVRWWLGIADPLEYQLHYMPHSVDLFYHLSGGEIHDRHIERHRDSGFEYFVVTARRDDGGLSILELTGNMGPSNRWSRIDWYSKEGILSVRDFTEVTHYGNGTWGVFAGPDTTPYGGDRVWSTEPLFNRQPYVDEWGYVGELDSFRQAILGRRPAEATIADAAWGMALIEEMVATGAEIRGARSA
jgi:myo-inositol 2-dehydrogenase/D-chiro-inositol 1-dehydrogenase